MKKLLSLILSLVMVLGLAACGGKKEGEVSVFYYNFADTYISTVRTNMDKYLKDLGLEFNNYDGAGNQTTQTEQIDTAIAKGSRLLIVNVVDTGSNDAAEAIVKKAKDAGIPLIFFNRSVEESVVSSYDKCVFVGTDYEMAGHMQGEMVGNYVKENFDTLDLNKDGKISYVMFKGQEGNMEAEARTQYGVEDADKVLTAAGKAKLEFYDAANAKKYLVDQQGNWSDAAAKEYMDTIFAKYSEANGNMVELVIANNDGMALGAVSGLQEKGYNKEGGKVIPVFGVDAVDAAVDAINKGAMTGTIKQDADGMAKTITTIANNYIEGKAAFESVEKDNQVGTWRVNIPYAQYTGK
jgi:methyl-galactoside transport system substrate-binding protein